MATARERLMQALTVIISQPFSEDGKNTLNRLLSSYRIQAKPGENLEKDQTARDLLASKIINAWKKGPSLDTQAVLDIVCSFRMQLKQGLTRRTSESMEKLAPYDNDRFSKGLSRSQIRENSLKHENAYFKDKYINKPAEDIPIAGGPKQSPNSRGICPKCRSKGIVLARAYGGEDYHSCIYCGYQAYLKGMDPKLDLPLAAELLGGALHDPNDDED